MISKYVFGNPIETDAVIENIQEAKSLPKYLTINRDNGFCLEVKMGEKDIVYGLGENVRGINKRGWIYKSSCCDEKDHDETKNALYCAHNFLIIDGIKKFGLFIDDPEVITFDIGYTQMNCLRITAEKGDMYLYVIEGANPYQIVKEFRKIIGQSYAAPRWAFGYHQSRWGYGTEQDIYKVVNGYRKIGIPFDAIGMDIDYMENYKDFTIDKEAFPNFEELTKNLRNNGIRLVPIIDAGVKIEDGYDVYEEGTKKGFFCKRENGEYFEAGVWPGWTYFPDFLNSKVRKWFGGKYKMFLDMGIEGFWNDMNEPTIFYSREELDKVWKRIETFKEKNMDVNDFFEFESLVANCLNNRDDYCRFYHNIDDKVIRHDEVHNLYGYNMTRAAGETFDLIKPNQRVLLFSRSSYIGMHRYGGIWTGDNKAWWSHILLNLKMLPSLNMCGFLYIGADLGGFAFDTTKDLMMRWLALGIFTPLMRNHARRNTRRKEFYEFEQPKDFCELLKIRYALIPYLYSEYMKAVKNNDMMFCPLAFIYPEDVHARQVEDQLMVGEDLMIAPIYEQNATGRYVYLPEDMLLVRFESDEKYTYEYMKKGHHYIDVSLKQVPVFIRKNHILPICKSAHCTDELDTGNFVVLGAIDHKICYELYEDDGYTKNYDKEGIITRIYANEKTEVYAEGKIIKSRLLEV